MRSPESSQPATIRRHWALLTCLTAWAVVTVAGFGRLWAYSGTPGPAFVAPPTAPPSPEGTYTLLLFLHPECPCSRATLSELDRLAAHTRNRVTIRVYFVIPPGADREQWTRAALVGVASAMPGVRVDFDPAVATARRYGAATSGQALLYTHDGQLAFSGGITAARAHEGDNAGSDAILSVVGGKRNSAPAAHTPVFGCTLFDNDVENDAATPALSAKDAQ
jgi:hypothetical protein